LSLNLDSHSFDSELGDVKISLRMKAYLAKQQALSTFLTSKKKIPGKGASLEDSVIL
jgi:hypothetical protein